MYVALTCHECTTGALRVSDGGVLSARTLNASPGGNITVDVKNLEAINGGQLLTTAFSSGRAGNITVNASDSITLSSSDPTYADRLEQFGRQRVDPDSPASGLSARTEDTGSAGNLRIATGQLIVRDGAQVSASTSGSGQGGTLSVTAPQSVTLSGRGSLSAQATGNGNAGDLTINTLALTVQDRAEVSGSTLSGVGGDITLQGLNSLQVSNGGQISASTETGRAGSLNVNANENAADSVQLRGQGSGLFARATGGGDAGGLTINALAFTVADGAEATVSSQQGQAGNLRVTANSIFLDRGRLSAVTAKSQPGTEGANITLQVPDLLLMGNESRISADARGPANGGNINIDTKFLIASPPMGLRGSDIAANAVFGNGGRLNISASGIFGTQFRPEETPLNDITASSEFGLAGVVEINTPDVDPSRGLVNLPAELVDVSALIAQRCPADVGPVASKFVITGRGGLPPNPSDTLDSDAIQVDWVTLYPGVENSSSPAQATNSTSPTSAPIVEAQGWVIGDNGEVILTAQAPAVTPKSPWQTPAHCHASHNSS